MAEQTKVLGSFENGLVEFSIDYDDVTLIITAVRCINASTQSAWVKATHLETGRTYERVCAPGTIVVAVPTNPAKRMTFYYDSNKQAITGIDFEMMYPYG